MGVVFVVGLQPTICMLIVTQGFVRLRLTTPCARLWQAYSLRWGREIFLMGFLFKLMGFLFKLMGFLFRLVAFLFLGGGV